MSQSGTFSSTVNRQMAYICKIQLEVNQYICSGIIHNNVRLIMLSTLCQRGDDSSLIRQHNVRGYVSFINKLLIAHNVIKLKRNHNLQPAKQLKFDGNL